MTTAALALASMIRIGDVVTFTRPGTQDAICAFVAVLDRSAGDVLSAWVVHLGGRNVSHVPLADLVQGCERA